MAGWGRGATVGDRGQCSAAFVHARECSAPRHLKTRAPLADLNRLSFLLSEVLFVHMNRYSGFWLTLLVTVLRAGKAAGVAAAAIPGLQQERA